MKRLPVQAIAIFIFLLACIAPPAEGAQSRAGVRFGAPADVIGTGVLGALFSEYELRNGGKVQVLPVESRDSLGPGRPGEAAQADLLLSDSPYLGKLLKDAGQRRLPLLRSTLFLVGPLEDPAVTRGITILEAFRRIASARAPFISRGDGSGANTREVHLWSEAGVRAKGQPWYQPSGLSDVQTMEIASARRAYALVDRASYLSWKNRFSLEPFVRSDPRLAYIYEIIVISPPEAGVQKNIQPLLDFLASDRAREIIRKYGADKYGAPLYSLP